MSDAVRKKYTVVLDVNPDVWAMNYGTEPDQLGEDIGTTMRDVIVELLNDYFTRTGNRAFVTAVPK